jgi:hypothetical protein
MSGGAFLHNIRFPLVLLHVATVFSWLMAGRLKPCAARKYKTKGCLLWKSWQMKKPTISVLTTVMYSIGAATRVSGLLDVDVAFGILLSVTGKNIFFDRK